MASVFGAAYLLHEAATSLNRFRSKSQDALPGIQLVSDLHLEINQQYSSFTLPPSAPFLVLAGDIGRLVDNAGYLAFLEQLAPQYEKIFLVLGNHEFYNTSYESGLEKARALEKEPSLGAKVVLLQNGRWDDPNSNLTILGCTLWSAIPPAASDLIRARVSDFMEISGWNVEKHNQLHAEDVEWLREQIQQIDTLPGPQRAVVVATHYAPFIRGSSDPRHAESPLTPAFATELLAQGGWKHVKAWIFRHTHHSKDCVRDGIRVVANQRGYVFPGARSLPTPAAARRRDVREFDPAMFIYGQE